MAKTQELTRMRQNLGRSPWEWAGILEDGVSALFPFLYRNTTKSVRCCLTTLFQLLYLVITFISLIFSIHDIYPVIRFFKGPRHTVHPMLAHGSLSEITPEDLEVQAV